MWRLLKPPVFISLVRMDPGISWRAAKSIFWFRLMSGGAVFRRTAWCFPTACYILSYTNNFLNTFWRAGSISRMCRVRVCRISQGKERWGCCGSVSPGLVVPPRSTRAHCKCVCDKHGYTDTRINTTRGYTAVTQMGVPSLAGLVSPLQMCKMKVKI